MELVVSVRVNRKWPGNLEELRVYLPACSQRLGLGWGNHEVGAVLGLAEAVVCHQLWAQTQPGGGEQRGPWGLVSLLSLLPAVLGGEAGVIWLSPGKCECH